MWQANAGNKPEAHGIARSAVGAMPFRHRTAGRLSEMLLRVISFISQVAISAPASNDQSARNSMLATCMGVSSGSLSAGL